MKLININRTCKVTKVIPPLLYRFTFFDELFVWLLSAMISVSPSYLTSVFREDKWSSTLLC